MDGVARQRSCQRKPRTCQPGRPGRELHAGPRSSRTLPQCAQQRHQGRWRLCRWLPWSSGPRGQRRQVGGLQQWDAVGRVAGNAAGHGERTHQHCQSATHKLAYAAGLRFRANGSQRHARDGEVPARARALGAWDCDEHHHRSIERDVSSGQAGQAGQASCVMEDLGW